MPLKFLDILVLLGALQGFIIGGLLFASKKDRLSNKLMAFMLLLIAAACLNLYLMNQSWFSSNSILQFIHALVPLVVVMPIGPLIFFYVKSRLDPEFKFTRKSRIYFYPVLIDFVPQITAIVYVAGAYLRIFKVDNQAWGGFIDRYNMYADIPRWISLGIYLWLSARYIRSLRTKNQENSINKGQAFKWSRELVSVFIVFEVIWLIQLVPYLLPAYSDRMLDLVDWYPIYIPMAIMVYWLSVKGYYLQGVRSHSLNGKEKASNPSLPADTVKQAIHLLRQSMEKDRLFLDPGMNLNRLAEETGLASKTISTVLNQHLHKSFSDFINEYRVLEIKEKMLLPDNSHLTISGIAYDCGFNSQPTFHRAFKSITGLTPKEYLQKNSQPQI